MAPSTTPSEDVDMDSFAEDNAHCLAPPEHLATRFYRKTSARRRSSAHSSRRSSLSSHRSTLSCHGGPQSTHVAQHLRRASIIENRKARLADRAAHAEQVRLRAAIAKAAPRAVYREERLLAAQAAREKLLAEITARCEEEVRRAKKVAEETREKKAAEQARLEEKMAEKMADAARRRSMYQNTFRRPRTTSLAAVEEKKIDRIVLNRLSESAAAKIIQRSWRLRQRKKAVSDFEKIKLNAASSKNLSFEDLTKLISEEQTLAAAGSLLKRLGMIESGGEAAGDKGASRVFLSAYLMIAHPVQAFSHGGKEPQERELTAKADALLEAFEKSVGISATPSKRSRPVLSDKEKLVYLLNDFSSAFHAWRSQDLGVIIDVMVNTFVNLDMIIQATKNDHEGHVAEDYAQAVRHEQIKLLAKLKKLAGPEEALTRVRVAVRKARKQRAKNVRRPSEEHVPRSTSATVSSTNLNSAIDQGSGDNSVGMISRSTDSSPFISRLGQTMTVLPSNREIAHEMLINGTYEVQQQPWTDSRKHFMDALSKSMRQSMESGKDQTAADWARAMTVLIRDKVLNLITAKHPLYDRIDGVLDPKLVDQQCRKGMFSYASFFETTANLMAQICSPGRDEAIRVFAADTSSDTIDRLFALINVIDLMTLDHINFQFRMVASSVMEHGHEHEHSHFKNDIEQHVHALGKSRRWWANARSSLTFHSSSPPPNGNIIYARGIVDLVFSNTHLAYSDVPETLQFDWIRLLALRSRAFHVVATASTLLTTKIRLRRNREALWNTDAERLLALDLLSADDDGGATARRWVALVESSHLMPDATREGLLNFVDRVLPPAVAAAQNSAAAALARLSAIQAHEPYDAAGAAAAPGVELTGDVFAEQVATFVLKALREHIFARLSATSNADKVRVTTTAAEVLVRAGLGEMLAEVGAMVDLLERVRAVDLTSHDTWWAEIAAQS